MPLLAEIPLYPGILEGGDRGEPIVVAEPGAPAAQALLDLAGRLRGLLPSRNAARVHAALE